MKALFALFPLATALATAPSAWTANVRVHPAPEGETLSKDFRVTVQDQPVPVYLAKVAPADPARRWKAMDDKANSADYFELASFASFDVSGAVTVTVACPEAIQSAKVLPSSFGIDPTLEGGRLRLEVGYFPVTRRTSVRVSCCATILLTRNSRYSARQSTRRVYQSPSGVLNRSNSHWKAETEPSSPPTPTLTLSIRRRLMRATV